MPLLDPNSLPESSDFELQTPSEEVNASAAVVAEEDQVTENPEPAVSKPIADFVGSTAEERLDPNRIQVTVKDKDVPLVLLFGPPACGKTMTLIRLTRYLKAAGYQVAPVRSLRSSADVHYKRLCDGFDDMVNALDAASSTDRISFLLVEVSKDGRRLCQILEAPGEHYYNPETPRAAFPTYLNQILAFPMRKIFCVMVEPNWKDEPDRKGYVDRVNFLKTRMGARDKVIFVFNKIDQTNFTFGAGRVHVGAARKEIEHLYPAIFNPFRNVNPITKYWRTWDCDFVTFQTGDYTTDADGGNVFSEGPDTYPRNLWNTILKRCRG